MNSPTARFSTAPIAHQNLEWYLNQNLKRLRPPPKLKVSEWSDQYRKLEKGSSSKSGSWLTSHAEYQRGIMDAFNDPSIHTIVVMSSAQIGKTEILNNIVGYIIDQAPVPILVLQPTLEMAQSWSKDRLAPMLRSTPALKGKVRDPRSRDSGNTLLHKEFPGGHITIAGANSPSALASRPICVLLCDEVDRYPASAKEEGDPVDLAMKRTTTFWNRKIILISTPTLKGVSRIEAAYEESDQRQFQVSCPDCKEEQTLAWERVCYTDNQAKTAHYSCKHCGSVWNDATIAIAVRNGAWRASKESNGIAGFHLNELYSPWVKLSQMVNTWLKVKDEPYRLRTFINTVLGETYEERGESIDQEGLLARREDWGNRIPNNIVYITMAVDVQQDRIEGEIRGWGIGEESWSLDYFVFYGDPNQKTIWVDVDGKINSKFERHDGIKLSIRISCVDSGYLAEKVYAFVKPRHIRGVYSVKGARNSDAPLIPAKPSAVGKIKAKNWMLGTQAAKEVIYANLNIETPGPGYFHFPIDRSEDYFKQLTAEHMVLRVQKGAKRYVWEKKKGHPRNEAIDLAVYNYAALAIGSPDLEKLASYYHDELNHVQKTKKKKRKGKIG